MRNGDSRPLQQSDDAAAFVRSSTPPPSEAEPVGYLCAGTNGAFRKLEARPRISRALKRCGELFAARSLLVLN